MEAVVKIKEYFRPARVAIVIPHGDLAALDRAVRLNTALLGGMFNPIIPFSPQSEDEAVQMVRFFDVDLFHSENNAAIKWVPSKYLTTYPEWDRTLYKTVAGSHSYFLYQDIVPLIRVMSKEVARTDKKTPFLYTDIPTDSKYRLLFTMAFGAYPDEFSIPYDRLYRKHLRACPLSLSDAAPLLTFAPQGEVTPIHFTTGKLDYWLRGGVIVAGDPLDWEILVDYWNLRASGSETLFVPIQSFSGFESCVCDFLKVHDGASRRNSCTICFSRSSDDETRASFMSWFRALDSDLATRVEPFCISGSYWQSLPAFATPYRYVKASETLATISDGVVQYQTSFPKWLRCDPQESVGKKIYVTPSFDGIELRNKYLLDFPRDPGIEASIRRWSTQSGRITKHGLSMCRDLAHRDAYFCFPTGEEAIAALFLNRHMKITLSEPGQVARQIINHFNGIHGCRLFKVKAIRDVLNLLNDGRSRSSQEILKTIGHGIPLSAPDLFIEPSKPIGYYTPHELLEVMYRNSMVQQGWKLQCNVCSLYTWYPVRDIGDTFECKWCFAANRTPLLSRNPAAHFELRANGLFLSHGKLKGSVPVIAVLWRLLDHQSWDNRVYSTNINISSSDNNALIGELDFAVLVPRPLGLNEFKLIIGESRGAVDYQQDDMKAIRDIADRFGKEFVKEHLLVCVTTLKDAFSEAEKTILRELVKDGVEIMPLTRLELDPYDLHERFQGLPNQYSYTLTQLAANTRQLNLASHGSALLEQL